MSVQSVQVDVITLVWKMHVVLEIICLAVLSLFILCEAQTGKKWPDEVIAPPYHLLSVRAEKYILPLLPYDVDDLEPYIDRETVVAHYEGHHEAYRRKMNVALNDWREDVGLTGVICFDETSHTAAVWLAWKLATRRPCA